MDSGATFLRGNGSMELQENLKALAGKRQVEYFGIADITAALGFIAKQGGQIVSGYHRAVSLGIILPSDVVDLVASRDEKSARALYRQYAYDVINDRIDQAVSQTTSIIQAAGYRALPVPSSQILDEERLLGLISNKLAAHMAGLGWIGKSCLLVTPEHGPRVRWGTVLTDAPLEATGVPMEQRCGTCRICVDACPAKAFTGRAFVESEPREVRYAVHSCKAYFKEMEDQGMNPPVCGVCLYICPYGRKKPSNHA